MPSSIHEPSFIGMLRVTHRSPIEKSPATSVPSAMARGCRRVTIDVTSCHVSPRAQALAESTAKLVRMVCVLTALTALRHSARTPTTAGSATANSAVTEPPSVDVSARERERTSHQVGQDGAHLIAAQNNDEHPGESDGSHGGNRVLGRGRSVVIVQSLPKPLHTPAPLGDSLVRHQCHCPWQCPWQCACQCHGKLSFFVGGLMFSPHPEGNESCRRRDPPPRGRAARNQRLWRRAPRQ